MTKPDFALAAAGTVGREVPARFRVVIEAVCARPEIRPLSSPVFFTMDQGMTVPFRVRDGQEVTLSPRSLVNPSLSAVTVRHAIEIALYQRRLALERQGFWRRAVAAVLACRVAAQYFHSLVFLEQELARPHLRKWLLQEFERSENDLPDNAVIVELMALAGETVPVDRWQEGGREEAIAWAERLTPLAAPTEVVIATGGDSRSKLNSRTGLNNYGCCPRPRPWAITFASSTATSISDLAYQRAEAARGDLIAAGARGNLAAAYDQAVADARARLAGMLGLSNASMDIVLTGSGTDAELYALYLAITNVSCRVTNVIVAPDETGSGVVHAAGGRHFSTLTARGTTVAVGAPLQGFDPARVRVETVAVRDDTGNLLAAEQIDREVKRIVDDAVSCGDRILLHVVDSSKTGVNAPTLESVIALVTRYGSQIDVVVDACQGRLDPETLRAYLRLGWMVLFTGSKFFTGPPFSGALLVPEQVARRIAGHPPPPVGFADYCSRSEWPETWEPLRQALPEWRNFGLLFRWQAALWEMEAFYSVGDAERVATLSEFGRRIRTAIEGCSFASPIAWRGRDRTTFSPGNPFDELQTIFTFMVLGPDGSPLSFEQTHRVYDWLNVDISHQLPVSATEADLMLAQRRFHIGQPVKLGRRRNEFIGGLRISAGARLVSGVAHDPVLGSNPNTRLAREISDATAILDKIALIVRNYAFLSTEILPPTTDISLLYMV